jgi:hypothetical protein
MMMHGPANVTQNDDLFCNSNNLDMMWNSTEVD